MLVGAWCLSLVRPGQRRASSPFQLKWKVLGRSHHKFRGPTRRRAIKEGIKVVNRDWVNNQSCSLSHNIHVESGSFITGDHLPKLIWKILSDFNFLNLYTMSSCHHKTGLKTLHYYSCYISSDLIFFLWIIISDRKKIIFMCDICLDITHLRM